MTKLEQLKFDYLEAKGEMEAYQSDERCAHKKAIEYEEKMKIIEEEIKEIEVKDSEERIKKVNESIFIIKNYCALTKCIDCKFNKCGYGCKFTTQAPVDW